MNAGRVRYKLVNGHYRGSKGKMTLVLGQPKGWNCKIMSIIAYWSRFLFGKASKRFFVCLLLLIIKTVIQLFSSRENVRKFFDAIRKRIRMYTEHLFYKNVSHTLDYKRRKRNPKYLPLAVINMWLDFVLLLFLFFLYSIDDKSLVSVSTEKRETFWCIILCFFLIPPIWAPELSISFSYKYPAWWCRYHIWVSYDIAKCRS